LTLAKATLGKGLGGATAAGAAVLDATPGLEAAAVEVDAAGAATFSRSALPLT